jgi:hypothetical protein
MAATAAAIGQDDVPPSDGELEDGSGGEGRAEAGEGVRLTAGFSNN